MQQLAIPKELEPYVNEIYVLQNVDDKMEVNLPFYADGYPGIVYSESKNRFYLRPQNKQLSDFYLYGQTIEPICLQVKGNYQLIGIRLYPFVVRMLLGVNPMVLNDDCFDLMQLVDIDTASTVHELRHTSTLTGKLNILANYFTQLVKIAAVNTDYRIKLALNLIISSNGNISVKQVRDQLFIAERTFERQFSKEVGVTPKQFARIIQFSTSMKQISKEDYATLTEIGHENGFADQSHFIRTFKRFTGKTPKEYQKQISA